MVELLGGAELPVQVGLGLESTIGGGAVPYELTAAFADAQLIKKAEAYKAAQAAEWEASQTEKLAVMEATAERQHEFYYSTLGTGYGTTPGGPDVYYFPLGRDDPPVYEEGTFFGADLPSLPGKDDLLLYGALAIGALALLKR